MVNRFTAQEGLENMIEYTMHFEDHVVKIGNHYYRKENGVLTPSEIFPKYSYRELSVFWSEVLNWIYQNAEIMRWTLVDESIPLESKEKAFDIFDGCRRTNAMALGILKYWPALPEFREVMLHEQDAYLRELCINAISEMGIRAYGYRKDIRQVILDSDNPYLQEEGVKALAKLNDKNAAPMLQELFYDTISKIEKLSYEEMLRMERIGFSLLMETILEALQKLDLDAARECLAVGLISNNDHIYYFSKRAFALTKNRFQMGLMARYPSILLGFLPKDLSYRYLIRQR